MTGLTSLFAPDTLRTLGWSLLHFVWQGFALAAVASVALTLFRRASTRYIVGVLTLFAMVTSVACTFVVLLNSQAAMQATESAATPFIVCANRPACARRRSRRQIAVRSSASLARRILARRCALLHAAHRR